MKFLCLAYGAERDWKALSKKRQTELLAADEVLRERGDQVAPVSLEVTRVRGDDRVTTPDQAMGPTLPLAGFGIIEADSLDEVVELVSKTPCAQANGVIEIREIR